MCQLSIARDGAKHARSTLPCQMGIQFLAPPDVVWTGRAWFISAELKQDKLFVESGVKPDLLSCYKPGSHQKQESVNTTSTDPVELPTSLS